MTTLPLDINFQKQVFALITVFIQQVLQTQALQPTTDPNKLLDDTQAADVLGIAKGTLAVWRHQGKGPDYVKIGANVRYRYSALQQYIDLQVQRH